MKVYTQELLLVDKRLSALVEVQTLEIYDDGPRLAQIEGEEGWGSHLSVEITGGYTLHFQHGIKMVQIGS